MGCVLMNSSGTEEENINVGSLSMQLVQDKNAICKSREGAEKSIC